MSMTFAQSLDTLDTILGDAGDVTFTPEEKTRAMTRAWNDSYVVQTAWDESLTFTDTDYNYTVPATLKTIKDIYLSRSNDTGNFPEPISSELWEVVDGVLQFSPPANSVIPTGYTLYLKGNYKVTVSDTIDDAGLEEYVLSLAGVNTLTLLGFKKANLFLKNDTSMGELIALKRELQQDVREGRLRLQKDYEGA